MPPHRTNAYNDSGKWVVFCEACGLEEDELKETECKATFSDRRIMNADILQLDRMKKRT